MNCILSEMAPENPKEALEIAEREFGGERAELTLRSLSREWAMKDLESALTWVSSRGPGEGRDGLFYEMALSAAARDPQRGARIVAEQISPGPIQSAAALAVLDEWAQSDLVAASEWMSQFPSGQTRDHAMLHLGRMAFYQSGQSQTAPPSGQ